MKIRSYKYANYKSEYTLKQLINNYAKENKIDTIIINKNENIEMKLKELKWLD